MSPENLLEHALVIRMKNNVQL